SHEIVFTWGDEVELEPTPTPWPTWNPSVPTPTPVTGVRKVLWFVDQRKLWGPTDWLYDDFTAFQDIFTELGAESETFIVEERPITDDLLSDYAVVIFESIWGIPPLAETEQQSVLQFVRSGGSIFVLGSGESDAYILSEDSVYCTSITQPFGIRFSAGTDGQIADYFEPHPVTEGVTMAGIMGSSIFLIQPPGQGIGFWWDDAVLAVAEDGYGRVVAFPTAGDFHTSGYYPYGIDRYSHRQLATNIAKWLLHYGEEITEVDSWWLY
ncbi:MAG: hypothetical protein ABIH23_20095, partial [bacterium]